MGPKSNVPPSLDAKAGKGSTPSSAAVAEHVDASIEKTKGTHGISLAIEEHQEPEKNHDNLNSIGNMMSVGTQDNVNLEEVPVVSPGVVSVQGTHGPDDHPIVEGNGTSDVLIEAHLAPDEADVEALLKERLATMVMPVVQEVEERMRQQTRVSLTKDDDIMVAEEVKNVSSPQDALKKRRNWLIAFVFLLAGGGGGALLASKSR